MPRSEVDVPRALSLGGPGATVKGGATTPRIARECPRRSTQRRSRSASHEVLFPRSAVSIHHGSVGTLVAAFRAGVPRLAAPFAFAQPFRAQRVKDLGEGHSMVLGEWTVPVLARALERLLSSADVHGAAARVRPEMPCRGRTAEGIILAVVSATPAAQQTHLQRDRCGVMATRCFWRRVCSSTQG